MLSSVIKKKNHLSNRKMYCYWNYYITLFLGGSISKLSRPTIKECHRPLLRFLTKISRHSRSSYKPDQTIIKKKNLYSCNLKKQQQLCRNYPSIPTNNNKKNEVI